MKQKQYLALFLALAFLLPALALAEDGGRYIQDEEFTLTFQVISNASRAVAATMKVEYDHEVFEILESPIVQKDSSFLLDLNGIKEGTAIDIDFHVLPEAKEGVYSITMYAVEAADIDENVVDDMAFSSFQITVKAVPEVTETPAPTDTPAPTETPAPTPTPEPDVFGDTNGDKRVNLLDVIRLQKYLSGWDVGGEGERYDISGDGKVSIMDVIRLQKIVAGWEE